MTAVLRAARAEDAPSCAAILRAWIAETPWFPRLHPPEVEVRFVAGKITRGEVTVLCSPDVTGFLALEGTYINCLYLAAAARGQGNGRCLLDYAKARSDELRLWTFQANLGAQAFYLREGFVQMQRTDGADNAEKLPDIEYCWRRPGTNE